MLRMSAENSTEQVAHDSPGEARLVKHVGSGVVVQRLGEHILVGSASEKVVSTVNYAAPETKEVCPSDFGPHGSRNTEPSTSMSSVVSDQTPEGAKPSTASSASVSIKSKGTNSLNSGSLGQGELAACAQVEANAPDYSDEKDSEGECDAENDGVGDNDLDHDPEGEAEEQGDEEQGDDEPGEEGGTSPKKKRRRRRRRRRRKAGATAETPAGAAALVAPGRPGSYCASPLSQPSTPMREKTYHMNSGQAYGTPLVSPYNQPYALYSPKATPCRAGNLESGFNYVVTPPLVSPQSTVPVEHHSGYSVAQSMGPPSWSYLSVHSPGLPLTSSTPPSEYYTPYTPSSPASNLASPQAAYYGVLPCRPPPPQVAMGNSGYSVTTLTPVAIAKAWNLLTSPCDSSEGSQVEVHTGIARENGGAEMADQGIQPGFKRKAKASLLAPLTIQPEAGLGSITVLGKLPQGEDGIVSSGVSTPSTGGRLGLADMSGTPTASQHVRGEYATFASASDVQRVFDGWSSTCSHDVTLEERYKGMDVLDSWADRTDQQAALSINGPVPESILSPVLIANHSTGQAVREPQARTDACSGFAETANGKSRFYNPLSPGMPAPPVSPTHSLFLSASSTPASPPPAWSTQLGIWDSASSPWGCNEPSRLDRKFGVPPPSPHQWVDEPKLTPVELVDWSLDAATEWALYKQAREKQVDKQVGSPAWTPEQRKPGCGGEYNIWGHQKVKQSATDVFLRDLRAAFSDPSFAAIACNGPVFSTSPNCMLANVTVPPSTPTAQSLECLRAPPPTPHVTSIGGVQASNASPAVLQALLSQGSQQQPAATGQDTSSLPKVGLAELQQLLQVITSGTSTGAITLGRPSDSNLEFLTSFLANGIATRLSSA